MPDANKFDELRAIGFRIRPTCVLCIHGQFPSNDWGTCAKTNYVHLKHTGPARQVSVHKAGHCNAFEADPVRTAKLGAHGEFLQSE